MKISDSNPVDDLFPEHDTTGLSFLKVLDILKRYGATSLAYDGSSGRNPGYIFRGEADFKRPLQCSLERSLLKKPRTRVQLDGKVMRDEERQLVTSFIHGPAGRAAAIFYPYAELNLQHPRDDVFWWFSLMQHYGLPTRLMDFTRDIHIALYFSIKQHDDNRKDHNGLKNRESKDLMIYCFPCRSPKTGHDPDNNKCPFKLGTDLPKVDMNMALGCQIGFRWMRSHRASFKEYQKRKRKDQLWGWDRPYYQNHRLESQKGMFVYPYDYPARNGSSILKKSSQSWLVRNLRFKSDDRFNLGRLAGGLPANRIRIGHEHVEKLKKHLATHHHLSHGSVYERCQMLPLAQP